MPTKRMPQIFAHQAVWAFIGATLLGFLLSIFTTTFATADNVFNISRNLSFTAIMAIGQTFVLLGGGIDLSVGSIMGLSGIVATMTLNAGYSIGLGCAAGLLTALACGLVNGVLIAYAGLSPFVVTLAMLSIAASVSTVLSGSKMIYEFGPDESLFLFLGGGSLGGFPNPVSFCLILLGVCVFWLRYTGGGRHLVAIGGNETAAALNGIAVRRIRCMSYVVSALCAGTASILTASWLGSITNSLGTGSELTVVAACVLGGISLSGGVGGFGGAVIGAALLEIIRNGLLLAGVDPYWQGTFVGAILILAIGFDRLRKRYV